MRLAAKVVHDAQSAECLSLRRPVRGGFGGVRRVSERLGRVIDPAGQLEGPSFGHQISGASDLPLRAAPVKR
jgi:hypothetical protein